MRRLRISTTTVRSWGLADGVCSIASCGAEGRVVRSWCMRHYQRWQKHGTPTPEGVQERDHSEGPCSHQGCPRPKVKSGYCGLHYQRFMKFGDSAVTAHEDVSTSAARRCRYCRRDISHRRSNAVWCDRSCKYWAFIWRTREGISDNPESIPVPGSTIDKILSSGQCSYCGDRGPVEIDHIIPIARGGAHREGNLAPACRNCNQSKLSKLLYEWRKRHA